MCICWLILQTICEMNVHSRVRYGEEAYILVEEDPVEISRGGEELFPHAELAGGDLDAGVDRSNCAA